MRMHALSVNAPVLTWKSDSRIANTKIHAPITVRRYDANRVIGCRKGCIGEPKWLYDRGQNVIFIFLASNVGQNKA